jgi:hypothetical protein
MEAFPFKLKMVIHAFKFSEYSWTLKYFFRASSQTSVSSPFLISPSKVGVLDFLNFLKINLTKFKEGKKPKFSLGILELKLGSQIFEVVDT